MKRIIGVAIVLLVAFVLSGAALAQDDAISLQGTFSGNANLLRSVSSSFSLNLTLSFASLTVISNTNFAWLPAMGTTQGFTMEYVISALTFGTDVHLGLIPLSFQSWDIYARLHLPDTTIGDGTDAPSLGGYFKVDATILPAFSSTSTLYVNMDAGPLSASSRSVVGIVPFSFQGQKFNLSIGFLNATLGDTGGSSASGKLGAYIDVLPSVATSVWLEGSLSTRGFTAKSYTSLSLIPTVSGTQAFTLTYLFDSITLTSKTTLDLIPLGFSSEYLKVNATNKDVSVYGWGRFAPARQSAGIGFSYSFYTGSN